MITHQKNYPVTAWFSRFAKNKLKKSFSRVSLTADSRLPDFKEGVPTVVLVNHASWWDALLVLYVGQYILRKEYYGVFDEEQLKRYGIFRMIGAYSVNRQNPNETRTFLRYTKDLLKDTSRILWIFPQGDIVSADQLPLVFKKGFASILSQLGEVQLLKMAVSYDFWLDSKPEIVMDIAPIELYKDVRGSDQLEEITQKAEIQMTAQLEKIRSIIHRRDDKALTTLLEKSSGTNFYYDLYRKVKCSLQGKSFTKEHRVKEHV